MTENSNHHRRRPRRSNNRDKEKLEHEVKKIMTTIMIGALDIFEKSFGYLWGEFKDENEPLTPQEEDYLALYEEMRTHLLDYCNDQIRKTGKVLDKYNIQQRRYHIDFKVKNR